MEKLLLFIFRNLVRNYLVYGDCATLNRYDDFSIAILLNKNDGHNFEGDEILAKRTKIEALIYVSYD